MAPPRLWRGLALLAAASLLAMGVMRLRFVLDAGNPAAEGQVWVRPWFMAGALRTSRRAAPLLWPHQAPGSDRIVEQLMFVPPPSPGPRRLRTVLLYHGWPYWWYEPVGSYKFRHCPVNSCTFSINKSDASHAEAILFYNGFENPGVPRPTRQVWILYHLESPMHTLPIPQKDVFNWTATYRLDSDIVDPYGRWVYYDDRVRQMPQTVNYAANKTRKVAWFVSDCRPNNNKQAYARHLQKHIPVDVFGKCGTKQCFRNDTKCFHMLARDYKFYLAFENSNCKHYITEKFYVNALKNNVVPVVMGARPEDYARVAPEHSYIHVDDFASVEQLAAYLHQLDADDDLYNSYFRWKGTGEFIDIHFFCRLCALLHDDFPTKGYSDINKWWRGSGICTRGSWRNVSEEADQNLNIDVV